MLGILIALLIIGGVIAFLISVYNRLIRQRNQIDNALSQIDVQLKRRHDLIPNLVEVAKKYMDHENQVLVKVTKARDMAKSAFDDSYDSTDTAALSNMAKAESKLSKALANFFAVAESYPELKADGMMIKLMDEITNTENRISFARQHYNDSVMFYNNQRQVFPNNIISSFFGFDKIAQLHFEDKSAIAIAPKVSFDD